MLQDGFFEKGPEYCLPSAELITRPCTSLPSGNAALGSLTKESERWPIFTRASAFLASATNTPALLTAFTYPDTCTRAKPLSLPALSCGKDIGWGS